MRGTPSGASRGNYRRKEAPRQPVSGIGAMDTYALSVAVSVEKTLAEAAPSLFDLIPTTDGPLLNADDHGRLHRQRQKVYDCMRDGVWRSLGEIAAATNSPEASVSARLRDFRKGKFGGHTVERRRVTAGLWEYRLIVM